MLFLPFLTTSNTWLYTVHLNTKKILIYDVHFIKDYNIYRNLFAIQLCSILAKCWKLSKNAENDIFSLISSLIMSILA